MPLMCSFCRKPIPNIDVAALRAELDLSACICDHTRNAIAVRKGELDAARDIAEREAADRRAEVEDREEPLRVWLAAYQTRQLSTAYRPDEEPDVRWAVALKWVDGKNEQILCGGYGPTLDDAITDGLRRVMPPDPDPLTTKQLDAAEEAIVAEPSDMICLSPEGHDWPCGQGRRARIGEPCCRRPVVTADEKAANGGAFLDELARDTPPGALALASTPERLLADDPRATLEQIGARISAWISVALDGVEAEGELIDPPLGEPIAGFVKGCNEILAEIGAALDAPSLVTLTWDHVRATLQAEGCGKLTCACCVKLAGAAAHLCNHPEVAVPLLAEGRVAELEAALAAARQEFGHRWEGHDPVHGPAEFEAPTPRYDDGRPCGDDCPACALDAVIDKRPATPWTPTPEAINALPEGVRSYIHDLEARSDPAGDVYRRVVAEHQARNLAATLLNAQQADAPLREWLQAKPTKRMVEVECRETGWVVALYDDHHVPANAVRGYSPVSLVEAIDNAMEGLDG